MQNYLITNATSLQNNKSKSNNTIFFMQADSIIVYYISDKYL